MRRRTDVQRLGLLVGASVVIFEARTDALIFMAAAALLAWLALVRLPAGPVMALRPLRLLGFAPYFLWQSARGGVDVAVRAFRGPTSLQPGFLEYRTRLPPGARVILANVISLMPGTFTARLTGDRLLVHTLDATEDVARRLADVEARLRDITAEAAE